MQLTTLYLRTDNELKTALIEPPSLSHTINESYIKKEVFK
jgi:hypothetical protein